MSASPPSKPEEQQLQVRRVRPRFHVYTPYSAEEVLERIRIGLADSNAPCKGRLIAGHATLFLPIEEQHYWSPQLSLSVEDDADGSLLRGLYGPRPAVWTMFVFFYSLIGVAILFVAIFGFSYKALDGNAGILWLLPVLVLIFLTLYLVAYFGKRLGHDQIEILHHFTEKCIDTHI